MLRLYGCILILTLPFICSSKEFYAINSSPSAILTCYKDNEQFQPCGTLDKILGQFYYQNISEIYLLDRELQITRNIHLNFSSHYKVEIKPWRNNSFSTLVCNSDFTMTFNGIKEIVIQSILFKECVKSKTLILIDTQQWLVMLVQVINVIFIQSGQSSLQIISDVHELQVINCTFTGGRNDVDIIIKGIALKAVFRSTVFRNNRIGSLIAHGSLNESSTLDIQNCTFSYNAATDFNIQLYSLHSIMIESSYFEENYANNFIQVEYVTNMSVVNTYFQSNVVKNGLILHLGCGHSSITSFFSFDNNFVINNTAILSDGGIVIVIGLQTYIRDCVFQGNVANGNGSALAISESSLTVINMTIFKENEASLGGAVTGKSIQCFYVYGSNFTANSAESGGALMSIEGKVMVMENSYFNSNIAKEHGGALQIHALFLNITGSHYFNNTALGGDGGAINITSNNLYLASSYFSSNNARSGGAISINKGYQGHFFPNIAERRNTGAIATEYEELEEIIISYFKSINISDAVNYTVDFSSFNNNTAEGGGAISCTGIVIIIAHSNFSTNNALINGGGAILLDTKFVLIQWCTFQHNHADDDGLGGAILSSVSFLSINNSFFYTNEGRVGGAAIHVVSGITLELHSCSFDMNRAIQFGAAINVDSLTTFVIFKTNFTINLHRALMVYNTRMLIIWNCLFSNNTSYWKGGAIWVRKRGVEIIYIANCTFRNNSAVIGGAIAFDAITASLSTKRSTCTEYFDRIDAIIDAISTVVQLRSFITDSQFNKSNNFNSTVIVNCTFSHNTATDQNKGGAISVQGLHSKIIDELVIINCTLVGNSAEIGGAIFCYYSKLFVKNAIFDHNTAQYNGGGVVLERSNLCFTGNVTFIANIASSKGGALYSKDEEMCCKENSCPVLWTNQSSLRFVDNVANEGPAVFGGMLNQCNKFPEQTLLATLKRLEFDGIPYIWNSYAITSSGMKFCFNSTCKIQKVNKSISPGQTFTVSVACLDQLELPLKNCIVKSDGYESAMFQLGGEEYRRTIDGVEQLSFHLYSSIINSTSLIIYSDLLCSKNIQSKIEVLLDVKPCPIGFYLDKMECICDYRLKKIFNNIMCDIENESIFISSGWFRYKERYLRIHNQCPLNYCQKQRYFTSPLQPNDQCANNRGGILCGGCLANYSVVLGNWKCMNCTHMARYNLTWLTVVMALAGVVLVVFLLLVKMTVSSGTINGLISYANIVSFSGLLDHQNCVIHPFLHIFISWINLDLGIEVCFYSGMDVYQKTWLQFVFPLYIWFLVGVIILMCHYSSTVMKLMGMRNIEVLATLFLLSYAKLLKTIVTALSVTNIMVASADNITDPLRPHKVWVYDGNIEYFGPKHLPLFIVAVLFLLMLFMLYTLFLLCGQWLQYMPRRRGLRWIHGTIMSTIMDAYHAPYTKHHRYWTGLGLLIRCCLFTIFGTSYSTGINLMSIIVAVILLQVIRIASSGKLYRYKVVGLLELFYFSNLGILATVLLVNNTLCAAITISISLSFIVFVVTLLHHLHQETKQNSLYKMLKKKIYKIVNIIKTKCDTSENEQKNVISEQGSTTSYFELRESLIDSTV